MRAETVALHPGHPDAAFSRCREVLLQGGVVAYPTDTFYGLGVDPSNIRAVERLFEIKGRGFDQPILLLIKDRAAVKKWAAEVSPEAEQLMSRYWPGPLTLVFKAGESVLPRLTGNSGTIGLRVPGSALTRQLLAFLDQALTGTSANISGKPSSRSAQEVQSALGERIDLILDGGTTPGGSPSTVVDVTTPAVRVIREGAVKV